MSHYDSAVLMSVQPRTSFHWDTSIVQTSGSADLKAPASCLNGVSFVGVQFAVDGKNDA